MKRDLSSSASEQAQRPSASRDVPSETDDDDGENEETAGASGAEGLDKVARQGTKCSVQGSVGVIAC